MSWNLNFYKTIHSKLASELILYATSECNILKKVENNYKNLSGMIELNVSKQMNLKSGSAWISMFRMACHSEPQPQNLLQLNDFVVSVGGV